LAKRLILKPLVTERSRGVGVWGATSGLFGVRLAVAPRILNVY